MALPLLLKKQLSRKIQYLKTFLVYFFFIFFLDTFGHRSWGCDLPATIPIFGFCKLQCPPSEFIMQDARF